MAFLSLVLGCALACAAQEPADPVPSDLPVSVERIRARLQQPSVLRQAVDRKPDFRATVIEDFTPPETVLEALRRELSGDVTPKRIAPGTISPPLISVELVQLVTQVKRRGSAALHARAERNARAEVAAALAEFCAQHDCAALEPETNQSAPEGVLTH